MPRGIPSRSLVYAPDVRDRDAVAALERDLSDANLLPDVIINNAGLSRGLDPIQEGHIDDWEEMIDTNVKRLLYVTRAFLPYMVAADHGHVVNIGSTAGHLVYRRGNVYDATKFAVNALSHATSETSQRRCCGSWTDRFT